MLLDVLEFNLPADGWNLDRAQITANSSEWHVRIHVEVFDIGCSTNPQIISKFVLT